ncbi:MAG: valine--tRNA ligase [Bacilli bacterium]|nr:valine--tRNA ligase [Bacilli bacterium]
MLDKKYNHKDKEIKWINYWKDNKIYEFKPDNREVYSIDTPPPTVNGKIHIGHIFSYSQAEMIARYKRLRGYNVFYPFGFDDNGLPSERLVEKEINKKAHEVGREEFSKLCFETTNKYEEDFKDLFTRAGFSANIDNSYKTVSNYSQKLSQLNFIELVEKGACYRDNSPALWCNECLTSIAQAELETKTIKTTFNYLNFKTKEDNEEFTIATTRPELIPAIVCVFVNPKDKKNKHLIGKTAVVPILDIEVPIMADDKVAIDKGTGIVMCCTFGDQTDIEWWKKYNLPLKNIFTDDGRIINDVKNYGGLTIKEARTRIIEDFMEEGYLVKQEELEHEVQTHERCGKEVEYTIMKQWFIDIMNHKKDFIKIGNEIKWYPKHMHARYNEWVENISWDWCISRQRYFGVPFPVWYCKKCNKEILANKDDLPVNPLIDKPSINKCECGCTEFIPETDIMDTWQTSSITPLLNMRYKEKDSLEDLMKPMGLRCNAHDIIRTWDFYSIVKSYYNFNMKPWNNIMISGFVMAGAGEKISKRKANSKMEPLELLDEYGADVVRYWAGSGKLGTDIIFNDETFLRGKKLINKIWNVSKFIEMHLEDYQDKEFNDYEYLDRYALASYKKMEKIYLKHLDNYEIGLALNILEKYFWNFCDNYIEIVKHRLYRPEEFGQEARYSGQKTIYILLYKLLQDFSIYFPFITEEIYQEIYHDNISIHLTTIKELNLDFDYTLKNGDEIIELISKIRGEKTNKQVSLKTIVKTLKLNLNKNLKEAINLSLKDFKATLFIDKLEIKDIASGFKIDKVELDEEERKDDNNAR